jgi:HicA toxin of bacterial toxin-antitoxin,
MHRKHQRTLELVFSRPVSGSVKWRDIEALFVALGAEVTEREGSRVGVKLFADRRVFHRPHPSTDTDKAAVESVRKWLETNGVKP